MRKIKIHEEFDNEADCIYCLEEIIKLLRKGFTSGINPTFEFFEVKEDE